MSIRQMNTCTLLRCTNKRTIVIVITYRLPIFGDDGKSHNRFTSPDDYMSIRHNVCVEII